MIARFKNLSRGGWITFGIVLGAILAPGVALAAFSDIRIVGVSGAPPAQVTPANQLRVAEMDASRHRRFVVDIALSGVCLNIDTPAGNAFMLKQAVIDVTRNLTPSQVDTVNVYGAKGCPAGDIVATHTPPGTGTIVIPFEPGIAVKSGDGLSLSVSDDGIRAYVHLLGYTMPSGAVPATMPSTIAVSSKAPSKKQR